MDSIGKMICGLGKQKSYSEGVVLFEQEESFSGIYLVLDGKVKILKSDAHGREALVRIVTQNQVFGFRALVAKSNYLARAQCAVRCEIVFVEKQKILDHLQSNPKLYHFFFEQLCEQLDFMEKIQMILHHKKNDSKLAELLLFLDYYEGQNKTIVEMPLSLRETASLVGMAYENLSRVLSKFKREGLISLEGRQLILLKREKLVELSVECL